MTIPMKHLLATLLTAAATLCASAETSVYETEFFSVDTPTSKGELRQMHTTIIVDTDNATLTITPAFGKVKHYTITDTAEPIVRDGATYTLMHCTLGSIQYKVMQIIPEDDTQPVMFGVVTLLGCRDADTITYISNFEQP